MSRGPAVRQADIARVLETLKRAGMGAQSITVLPGGGVEIKPGPLTEGGHDQQPAEPVDELTAWRDRKNGRRAPQRPE